MAIVLTNGKYYVTYHGNHKTRLTDKIEEAFEFTSVDYAIQGLKRAPTKTGGFYVYDTETKRVCWMRMTPEEIQLMREGKLVLNRNKPELIQISKKQNSLKQRYGEALYNQANCRCQLCGRKITYQDATVDHIMPKAMGGVNDVSNLQIACYACNQLKGSVLPDSFMQRVSDIFMYQMSKKFSHRFAWKIASMALRKLQEQ